MDLGLRCNSTIGYLENSAPGISAHLSNGSFCPEIGLIARTSEGVRVTLICMGWGLAAPPPVACRRARTPVKRRKRLAAASSRRLSNHFVVSTSRHPIKNRDSELAKMQNSSSPDESWPVCKALGTPSCLLSLKSGGSAVHLAIICLADIADRCFRRYVLLPRIGLVWMIPGISG